MNQVLPALDRGSADVGPIASEARYPRPVRICFPFGGGLVGGSHISTVKLIQGLDRTRYTPVIALHHGSGQFSEMLRSEGLDFVTLDDARFFGNSRGVPQPGGAQGIFSALSDQWALARFLKQQNIRIVHTNEGAMHVSWALPARMAGAKLLWHHRGTSDARGVRYIAPFVANRIVGVSDFALSEVRRITAAARDRAVVYSPFDTEFEAVDRTEAHAALTSELKVEPTTRLIGFFANFVESKRPAKFIDMISSMARGRPDLPFLGLMFGSPLVPGIESELMKQAEALGVTDRLRLMGFRYPSTRYMAGCDIHAVPAIGEPFGRSLIEAMLLGTPVVAAASGGNLEAIEDGRNGLLTEADNPFAMAAAVVGLLEAPAQAAAIAETAAAIAVERYGVERHVSQISAIYQALLAESPSRW